MQVAILGMKEGIKAVRPIIEKYFAVVDGETQPYDFLIIVGGDGSILDGKVRWLACNHPVLKIHHSTNIKSLGYTCDVNINNLERALNDIKEGKYWFEETNVFRYTITSEDHRSIQSGIFLNDISIENVERASTILAKINIKDDEDRSYEENLPIAKCTGLLITGNHGSSAWNLALNGAVVVAKKQEHILLDIRESPLKPDKFIFAGTAIVNITPLCNCIIKLDREELKLEKNAILRLEIDYHLVIRFIKTTNTKESMMEKLLRFNKFQYEQLI